MFNCRTKIIIVNNPHNPTGKVFSCEELLFIADLCKKHNVICLSDEVYEWVVYPPNEHIRKGEVYFNCSLSYFVKKDDSPITKISCVAREFSNIHVTDTNNIQAHNIRPTVVILKVTDRPKVSTSASFSPKFSFDINFRFDQNRLKPSFVQF